MRVGVLFKPFGMVTLRDTLRDILQEYGEGEDTPMPSMPTRRRRAASKSVWARSCFRRDEQRR
jgi:hypothetical protein